MGPFDRNIHAHCDETLGIRQYSASTKSGTMIDVGAHEGYALMPFLKEAPQSKICAEENTRPEETPATPAKKETRLSSMINKSIEKKAAAVILGNGPSLRGFDFYSLSRFDVFGMNAAYRYWYEIGWFPQYYSCLDLVLGISHCDAILKLIRDSERLGIRGFLLRENLISKLENVGTSSKVFNFDLLRPGFESWIPGPVTTGSHTCAWASILGYKNIYLLGIDCNYVEIVPNAKQCEGFVLEIVKDAPNPNYFFNSYQQKGDKYNIPNPRKDMHPEAWRNVGKKISLKSTVLNANPSSRVDAFPFVHFDDVLLCNDIDTFPPAQETFKAAFSKPCFSYGKLLNIAHKINQGDQLQESVYNQFILACNSRLLVEPDRITQKYTSDQNFRSAYDKAMQLCAEHYSSGMLRSLKFKKIELSVSTQGD